MSPARSSSFSSFSGSTNTQIDFDAEAVRPKACVSHLDLVFDPSGVTWEVLDKRYAGRGTEESPFIVEFLPEDPHNPYLFPNWKKWVITVLQAFATLAVAFTSSAFSGSITGVMQEFHVSQETSILGVSLFVFGFAIGPLLWAPLSEFYGRQIMFFFTYMFMTAFNAGAAAAPNVGSLLALRFFAGAFGSSPLTNSGGVIADMFTASERGFATAVFAVAPFLGPSLGPIIGGFLGQAQGWRWVLGLTAIFTGIVWLTCAFVVPETYGPVLLRRRASLLTKLTGKVYISKLDAHDRKTMPQQFKAALLRPWVLLFHEPIVFLTSLYMAILYGTLYMLIAAFPIVFQLGRGWSPGVGGLPFIGIAAGMFVAVGYAMHDNKRYRAIVVAHDGAAPPEARLPPGIIGSVLLPIGLFIFAWTNGPEIHWFVPVMAGAIFAAGLVLVFLSLLNYLIDSYVVFAASVLAANSVMRSLFGAAFPLFTANMYSGLGIHWASTIPAFLALACMPFPFFFYRYGAAIRMRCKWAAEAAAVLERMRTQRKNQAAVQAKRAASSAGGGRSTSTRSYVRSEVPQLRWTLEDLRWVNEDDESDDESDLPSATEEDRTPYRLSRIPYFPSLTL